jgi:hypothetical protein
MQIRIRIKLFQETRCFRQCFFFQRRLPRSRKPKNTALQIK